MMVRMTCNVNGLTVGVQLVSQLAHQRRDGVVVGGALLLAAFILMMILLPRRKREAVAETLDPTAG